MAGPWGILRYICQAADSEGREEFGKLESWSIPVLQFGNWQAIYESHQIIKEHAARAMAHEDDEAGM